MRNTIKKRMNILAVVVIGLTAIANCCLASGDCYYASGLSACTSDEYDRDCENQTFTVNCKGGGLYGEQTVEQCGVGPSFPANEKVSNQTGGTCEENDDPDSNCHMEPVPCYVIQHNECVQESNGNSCSTTVSYGWSQFVNATVGDTITIGITTCRRLSSDIDEYGDGVDTAFGSAGLIPL